MSNYDRLLFMPKLIQESFSLELKIRKGNVKEGSESKVFLDEEFGGGKEKRVFNLLRKASTIFPLLKLLH